MPFSSGPTLFLAPSPIAWQARHLLNEALPAVASCADAPDTAINEVTTTSELKISVFIGCSSSLPWRSVAFWQARFDWTSHETLTGSGMAGLSESELTACRKAPALGWPTQVRPDVLDLP